jgi:pullulanase/glycogen debranching enzyme
LLSLGVPMIPMGDEVRHTQGGNNNAYCQTTKPVGSMDAVRKSTRMCIAF